MRPDIARKRTRWKARQGRVEPGRLVFIDETWVKTNMAPLRGWGPRGQRLEARVPHGHWKTLTFIAALRCDRVDAPWVIDGPINGELFTLYVEKVLGPTLAKGDVVILDNLGSHKGQAARRAIRAAGAHLLFLPPYSPDLNPIEHLFAKLKHLIRKAEPRTIEATWRKGRRPPRSLLTSRMCKLPQERWLCFRLRIACSRSRPYRGHPRGPPPGYQRLHPPREPGWRQRDSRSSS